MTATKTELLRHLETLTDAFNGTYVDGESDVPNATQIDALLVELRKAIIDASR